MGNLIGSSWSGFGVVAFFLIIVAGLIVVALAKLKAAKRRTLPYEKAALFTAAERAFFGVLNQAVGESGRIMGKIRLADVIQVKRGLNASARQTAQNQIQSKHLDFVVCDPADLSVQFAVELDDSSHRRAQRQIRDAFVEKALAAAGVPLLRFPVKRTYSVKEIQSRIGQTQASELSNAGAANP